MSPSVSPPPHVCALNRIRTYLQEFRASLARDYEVAGFSKQEADEMFRALNSIRSLVHDLEDRHEDRIE